jgi:hypothetical protein
LLLLDDKQLGIVAREFLEGDEEITEVESELIVLRVKRE